MYKGRLFLAGRKKIILSLLGLAGLCWIILGTSIISQLVTFCLSGVVPGTDYVVSAGMFMTVTVAIAGLLLFVSLVRLFRSHTQSRTLVRHNRMMELLRRTIPEQQPRRHTRRGNFAYPTLPVGLRLRLWLISCSQYVSDPLAWIWFEVKSLAGRIGEKLLIFMARFTLIVVVGLALLGHVGIGAMHLAGKLAAKAWQGAEPGLWQLDSWLENQVKKMRKTVRMWLNGYAATSVLQTIWQENSDALKKWRNETPAEGSLSSTDGPETETIPVKPGK